MFSVRFGVNQLLNSKLDPFLMFNGVSCHRIKHISFFLVPILWVVQRSKYVFLEGKIIIIFCLFGAILMSKGNSDPHASVSYRFYTNVKHMLFKFVEFVA
jgi:hypothetical protein